MKCFVGKTSHFYADELCIYEFINKKRSKEMFILRLFVRLGLMEGGTYRAILNKKLNK